MSAAVEYKEPTRAIFVDSDMRKFLGSTVRSLARTASLFTLLRPSMRLD